MYLLSGSRAQTLIEFRPLTPRPGDLEVGAVVVFIVDVKIVATCSGVRKRRSFEQGDGILYPAPRGPRPR